MTFNDLKEISLDGFVQKGEGATAYLYVNPSVKGTVLKVYKENVPFETSYADYLQSVNVYNLGVKSPKIFGIYRNANNVVISYEEVVNKVSITTAISKDLTKLDSLMKLFAEECLKLHSTECDTSVFPNVKDLYRGMISKCDVWDEKDKKIANALLDEVEDKTTCLHGDMHTGNFVLGDNGKFWIDLGGFSYGNPLFDLITVYFLLFSRSEVPFAQNNFHLNGEQMRECYKTFVKYYFNPKDEAEEEAIKIKLDRYSVFFELFGYVALGLRIPGTDDRLKQCILKIGETL